MRKHVHFYGHLQNGVIFIGKYISDIIDMNDIKPGQFNLITGGCGCGKTTFVLEHLLEHFKDVAPEEMIIVTSRSITAEQMQFDHDGVMIYKEDDVDIVKSWSDCDHAVKNPGVRVMTYDKIVDILRTKNYWGIKSLSNIKILVFDECHTLFTDTFMDGIREVTVWLREAIFTRPGMLFIGITATPKVLERVNSMRNKIPVVNVIPETIITYKARHMICTNFSGAIKLIKSGRLPGRSIMMCKRLEECKVIYETVPDSGVVISQSNSMNPGVNNEIVYGKKNSLYLKYEQYMNDIREYVSKNSDIPYRIYTDDGVRDLNLLVTTSTFREGFNLVESSGVKNVFVIGADEMQITQFLGRCRYDVENLIIVALTKEFRDATCYGYFTEASENFHKFVETGDTTWYDSIAHLLYGDVSDVEFYGSLRSRGEDSDGYRFAKQHVRAAAMLDTISHLISTNDDPVYIWRGHHDMEVCATAVETGLFRGAKLKETNVTLNRVMVCLQECGYRVEVFRKLPDGKRKKCYCIYRD